MPMREELEAILVELSVKDTDLIEHSFASIASDSAERMGGRVLFDVRIDGDPDVQRIAALEFAEGNIAFLILAANGTEVSALASTEGLSDFVAPLSRWFELPLHERAITPFRGAASLLIGALRRCGCIER